MILFTSSNQAICVFYVLFIYIFISFSDWCVHLLNDAFYFRLIIFTFGKLTKLFFFLNFHFLVKTIFHCHIFFLPYSMGYNQSSLSISLIYFHFFHSISFTSVLIFSLLRVVILSMIAEWSYVKYVDMQRLDEVFDYCNLDRVTK